MKLKVKNPFSHSIKGKLITVCLLLLILPLVVFGVSSYLQSSNHLDELGKVNIQNSVEHTMELIEALHEQVEEQNLTLEEAQEIVKVTILGEMQPDGTRPVNDRFDLGENGYLFIADSEANLLAHPTNEGGDSWDNTDSNGNYYAREYIETAINGGGFSYYTYPLPNNENQIEEKVTYSMYFPAWDWIVVGSTYLLNFNQSANELLISNTIVLVLTVIIGSIVIWWFANKLTKPIQQVTDQMKCIANANLSVDKLDVKTQDEIGELACEMNKLQDALKNMIKSIAESSQFIAQHSEELAQASNDVSTGAEQVATTMEEIANGTESQTQHINNISSNMQNFVEKVQEAKQQGDDVYQYSNDVLTLTENGARLMKESVQQMTNVDQLVHHSVEKMQALAEHSNEISQLITVIREINEQTNLLALNASIEAARAGDHGKGFAVVANEVRNLAEQTDKSVLDITEIIQNIQKETEETVDSLHNGYTEVEKGTKQIEATGDTFNNINDAITNMVTNIHAIRNNLDMIHSSSQQMSAPIEEIVSVSEETSAGIEQTSASSQQTSSSMEEITASSNELATLADKLDELVKRFKL